MDLKNLVHFNYTSSLNVDMKTAVQEYSMSNMIIQSLCRFSVVGRHKSSLCTCVFEQAFFVSLAICSALVLALYNAFCYNSAANIAFICIVLVTVPCCN